MMMSINYRIPHPKSLNTTRYRVTPFAGKTMIATARNAVKQRPRAAPFPNYKQDDVTLLRLDKLFGNYSVTEKVVWLLLLATSFSLCVWQVYICADRFLQEPIGRHIQIVEGVVFKLPFVTLCPASPIFGFYFDMPFDKLCNAHANCSRLNATEKRNYSIREMGVQLKDLWLANEITKLKVETRCGFLKNISQCPQNKIEWPSANKTSVDTIAGRCRILGTPLEWYYSSKTTWPWVFENIEMDTTMIKHPTYSLDTSINYVKSAEKLFVGHQAFKTNITNRLEFTITEFQLVNSSHHPCYTEAHMIDCQAKCLNKTFYAVNSKIQCRWPFMNVDLPYCNTLNEIEIFRSHMLKVRSALTNCKCALPCKLVRYTSSVTYYDSGNSTKIGIIPMTDTLQTVTEFYSYPFSSLVAEFGGSISLFLGLSVISLFEFLNTMIKKVVPHKWRVC